MKPAPTKTVWLLTGDRESLRDLDLSAPQETSIPVYSPTESFADLVTVVDGPSENRSAGMGTEETTLIRPIGNASAAPVSVLNGGPDGDIASAQSGSSLLEEGSPFAISTGARTLTGGAVSD